MQSLTTKRFVLAGIIWGASTVSALCACAIDKISLRGGFGAIDFTIEIADSARERAQGLMNRPSMPKLSGMLFVYESPGNLTFWMRNTLIPLDMIFIRPDGTIAHIHENAIPLDETPIPGGPGNLAVLEINGGLSRQFGIAVGDQVRHSAFADFDPIWPCT